MQISVKGLEDKSGSLQLSIEDLEGCMRRLAKYLSLDELAYESRGTVLGVHRIVSPRVQIDKQNSVWLKPVGDDLWFHSDGVGYEDFIFKASEGVFANVLALVKKLLVMATLVTIAETLDPVEEDWVLTADNRNDDYLISYQFASEIDLVSSAHKAICFVDSELKIQVAHNGGAKISTFDSVTGQMTFPPLIHSSYRPILMGELLLVEATDEPPFYVYRPQNQ